MTTAVEILDDVDRHANGEIGRLASLVHSEVTKLTPVDTGWARANWIPSIGKPADPGVAPGKRGKGDKGGPGRIAKVATATARAQKGLIEIFGGYHGSKFPTIFLTNNVPYVRKLDRTHKRRRGFINKGIERALQRFTR